MPNQNVDLEKMRHSASHLLAAAVLELHPDVKFGIGPAIENGFYYDFDFKSPITDLDLPKIEQKMREIKNKKYVVSGRQVSIKEAKEQFKEQPYKLELISDLEKEGEKEIGTYTLGDFTDLCRGPHMENTSEIGEFKLTSLAGAYWKGSEKNKMLTRIYGVAFATKEELESYLNMLAEAEKRDHRKLGKELGLFVFSDLVGSGLPLYTFKGATVRKEILNFSNELQKDIGYQEVHTPNMNKADLFKVSGHYEKFKDDMFRVVSNYSKEEYYLKPMNCPHHTQIYASQKRSYRDLPIRIADFANLYRDEKPGELTGLTRLRCFCQDDGHAFCREDQIKDEFMNVLGAIKIALQTYKMEYRIRLSLWDENHREKYLGEPEVWEKSQKLLEEILVENKIDYSVGLGEAAMYGPKMDVLTRDSLGREWQISTIQLDFIMPKRFELTYTDSDGQEKTPIMIHRAIVGSPERFMGILIEHYAGEFPVWLAPVQVKILPVNDAMIVYAVALKKALEDENIRVEMDDRAESLGKKIRNAELEKVPYMIIMGEKEKESGKLAVRSKKEGDLGAIDLKEFLKRITKEIKEKQ
ncbi:MAG: threonine--tRNA ligase [Patescibacteria group bacterium]|nr:threonine--tRNA ligase [Patescibacteria group bacterium]